MVVALERGTCVWVEGLDLSGKGTFLDAMVAHARERGLVVFDVNTYQKEHDHNPLPPEFLHADILYLSEMTYAGVGRLLRQEITARTPRYYSASVTAQSFALDRQILLEQVERPARDAGMHVLKSRSVLSSLVYQQYQACQGGEPLSLDEIRALSGNRLELSSPDCATHVLIATAPTETLLSRLGREKQDNSKFENAEFLASIKPFYESEMIRKTCEECGAALAYVDLSGTREETVRLGGEWFDRIFS